MEIPSDNKVIVSGPDANPIQVGFGVQQTATRREEADVIMA